MSEIFLKIVNMSISASWLVLAVLAFRLILKKAPKWVNVLLWGVVAIRLICPFSIESSVSLVPNSIGNGEFVSAWMDDYIGDIDIHHPDSAHYDAAIKAGLVPVYDGEGGYYVVAKHNQYAEPETVENTVMPVLSVVWLVGMIVLVVYTAGSYISLRRKLRTAVILRYNIFQCETVQSPFVLGVLRPRIYLPYAIEGRNLHHVVAHEQAHIRRKDHWWKPMGFLLLTVYWFNPLMWVAYILMCRDIELACDEKVIAELGNDQRADYTQALVACSVNRRMIAACPLAFGEVGVKERVKSIMNYRKPAFWVVILALITCVTVAVCFLTDPIDPTEDTLETDGMQMHQVSFPYATEEGYNLLIGADGVKEIQVSLPDSGGGVVNADGTFFKKGEKVYLEHLQGVTDLRGLSITALGKNGEILYAMSIPEDASMEETINTVGSDGWLLAPTEHIIGPAIAGKTYVYENKGIIGSFTITLYEDGTFTYYEGMASSYFGVGTWQQDGSIVTITDDEKLGYPLVNKFIMDGDDLVFAEQGSSNFIYVKLKEGERFHLTGEAFKTPETDDPDGGASVNVNDPTMWHDGISFAELEPNEEMVSSFELSLNKESNSVMYNITWARTGLTLEYGLRASDGTEYSMSLEGGSGNGQFLNLPAGSYRLFVRNTDYSGVPAYENPDLFPHISFNATGAMNYKLD